MCANNFSLAHLIIFLINVRIKFLQRKDSFILLQRKLYIQFVLFLWHELTHDVHQYFNLEKENKSITLFQFLVAHQKQSNSLNEQFNLYSHYEYLI